MRIHLLFFSVLIFGLFGGNTFSQTPKLDSLLKVWNDTSKPDSSRIEAYNSYITKGYLYSNPDSAILLTEGLISFAKEKNNRSARASAYNTQGIATAIKGDLVKALGIFELGLKEWEAIEGEETNVASLLNNIGAVYKAKGNDTKALEYYNRALKIFEKNNVKWGMANASGNIGVIYQEAKNIARAREYFKKSLAINREIGDTVLIGAVLGNLAVLESDDGNYQRSLEVYDSVRVIYEHFDAKSPLALCLFNISGTYKLMGNVERGLDYANQAMAVYKELNDQAGIAKVYHSIGALNLDKKSYAEALTACKKALALGEEMQLLKLQISSCECLYTAYKELGKGNEALVYLEKQNALNDSLNEQEVAKKLEQMEFTKLMLQDSITKADEARKVEDSHQSEVRRKNRLRNILIVSSLILLLIALGLYSRWRYVRKSRDIITKERDRSDNLLLNILPAEIAEELKQKGKAEARDFDLVSILFSDFKGFTEASSKMTAQELVTEINACFEAFDAIMVKHGVEKIKTIGDAYMAAGGLPVPSNLSVKNTVLAALEMQAFIANRKQIHVAQNKPAFDMRAGIHTGPVVAGIVGVKKFQYDIWGDTVNTASRLETNSAPGEVNISESTYEMIKDEPEFVFVQRDKIDVKGKGEMQMYFVRMRS